MLCAKALMAWRGMLAVALILYCAVPSSGQIAPTPEGASGAAGQAGAAGPAVSSCTTYFTAAGFFTSPNYPNNYANNEKCTYILTAASGGFIKLTFNDFDLENNYDFLTISDGSATIVRYTGSTRPPVLTLSRSVTLRFISDVAVGKKGFSIFFETIPANCGGLIVGSGVIKSPGYPQAYPDNLLCVWGVVATQGLTVTVDFTIFNLESLYDWLELYEGDSLVARYTEWNLPPQANLGPAGRLVFITDSTNHNTGFNVTVNSAALRCGGAITGDVVITSPSYPRHYPVNTNCYWTYRAVPGSVATRPTFSALSLENHYDFVIIYDGEYQRKIHTGNEVPKAIDLRSHTVTVIFSSDRTVTDSGFSLSITPVIRP